MWTILVRRSSNPLEELFSNLYFVIHLLFLSFAQQTYQTPIIHQEAFRQLLLSTKPKLKDYASIPAAVMFL
jgi:hypothetical protein